jgi:hypothetical protein
MSYLKSGAFTDVLKNTYSQIKAAAGTSAQVVAVGYPFLFPTPSFAHDLSADYHCVWLNGDAAQVLSRFQQGQLELDSVMATAATEAGIRFVPLDDVIAGHELCTGHSYFNDLSPHGGNTKASGHPNSDGQKLMAQAVAGQLGLLAGNGGLAPPRSHQPAKAPSARAKAPGTSRPKAATVSNGSQAVAALPARMTTTRNSVAFTVSSALPGGQVSAPYSGFLWATGGTAPYSWSVTAGSLPAGLSLDSSTGIISGTPTASGTSSFTVTATDSSSTAQTATADLSITVDAIPPLAIQTSQLASPTVGQQYSATLAAAGGIPPYTWAVTSGSLPAGLSLDTSSGALTGTPTAAGSRTFTVTTTDSSAGGGTTASATFTTSVAPATNPLTLTPPQLPAGTQGTGYTGQLTSTGGAAPLYWSIASGSLPDGLSLDPGTGQVTGIPTAAGTFSFTAQLADGTSPVPQSATENLSITIAAAPAPTIAAPSLPDAVAGSAYEQTIDASGGVPPYTWSVSSGSLPDGLSLDPQSGTISGTPTTPGSYAFQVSLSDSSTPSPMLATVSVSLTVDPPPPPPAMTVTDTVTDGTVGDAYSASVVPANGTGPYTYAVSAGALPDGLSLDPQNGTITGTPTTPGTSTASIQVTDSSSPSPQAASDPLSITIQPPGPLTITASALPDAFANTSYAQPITVTGGTGADTYAITAGTLPDGLSLDPGTGIISGTPTGTGSSSFTVTVTDSATPSPGTASAHLTLTTDATPSLAIQASTLPDAVQGLAYSQGLAATGGAPPYTWSVSSGSLPDGLGLDPASGIISGVPTGTGPSTFTVQATDSASPASQTATETLTLSVDPTSPLSIATSALDPATQGTSYSAVLDPDGGTGPVTWSLASGSLPPGLTLDPGTGTISGTPTGSGTSYFTIQATDSSTPAQTATATLSLEVIPLVPQSISFTPPASGAVGQSVTLSATGGGSGNPVVFSIDPSSGTGACHMSGTNGTTLHLTAVGSCVIDANQAGNPTYAPAPQAQATIHVIKATTTTTLTLSASSIPYGQETTLVFTIRVKPRYTGTPTGTVTVSKGTTKLCKATLSKGKATCSPSSNTILPAGVYRVRAAYSGSLKFALSKSGAKTLTITG